eukprot:gnl/TRDRNA2_/TRDRNA2_93101_c0_seq1.p1 gnl/TRDRNA2_/TRDRNA2_93101_c0~~gnl/TRDRNA2_/TRDRNA2_93101_c0_seq1.p1  ORF type:complete len:317 (+),score=53.80 gnl/TRDRNA2_/TRDRNA2_93101_c0_seq1:139-951(+)
MMDKATGRSRGFGFVTFQDTVSVDIVLGRSHSIDGKEVEVKPCLAPGEAPPSVVVPRQQARDGGSQRPYDSYDSYGSSFPPAGGGGGQLHGPSAGVGPATIGNRIFVGGLPQSCSTNTLGDYFSQFGAVQSAEVMIDKMTGRSRGFGYVSFMDARTVDYALSRQNTIDGKPVEVKICQEGRRSEQGSYDGGYASNGGYGAPVYATINAERERRRQVEEQANELVQLLLDPTLGLEGFLAPMLKQLKTAAANARERKGGGGGGSSGRFRPY